jgi:hypothetical protein
MYNLGTLEGGRSMSAENKALARRYFEEVWNLQKPAVLDQIIANGAIDHDPANPSLPVGPEGQKQLFTKYMLHFPTRNLQSMRSLPKEIWSPSAGRCVALTKVPWRVLLPPGSR